MEDKEDEVNKQFRLNDKRAAIVYFLMKSSKVISILSEKGYKIDLTKNGIMEMFNVTMEDIDSLPFSCKGFPSFE
jgi:hypothetical protein